jgi:hypothetical protein
MARRNLVLAALVAVVGLLLTLQHQRASLSNDYVANSRALLRSTPVADKVWAHRVNSLEALREAEALFAGVELDLVFDRTTQSFSVRHPPKPDTGLSLEEYLASSADHPELRLWFDWKNPTPDNVGDALSELARLDGKYDIRRRALVETPSEATFSEIAAVSRYGFLHGYYLPTERGLEALQSGPQMLARLGADVRAVIERGNYGAVTYDARLQPFVDQQLDGFLQRRTLRRFAWDPRISSGDPNTSAAKLSQVIRSSRLDALLIAFPSRFRR